MADNVAITAGSGTTIATDDVGGVHHQIVKRAAGGDGVAALYQDMASRSDTYTATGNGATVDVSKQGHSRFGIQVKQTGTVTSWQVDLQVSLDGVNFVSILSHQKSPDGDGGIQWSGAVNFPALYFRSSCVALTLGGGTNVVVTIIGMP